MIEERARQRLEFARDALAQPDAGLAPASADASFRSYWRSTPDSEGRCWIVMDAPPEREDIGPWLDVAQRLARGGIAAPEVRAVDRDRGFILMSDLGGDMLLPALGEDSVEAHYDRAMDLLVTMQRDVDADGLPPYDEARLVAEMELMPEWFLGRHLGFTPECEQWDVVESAFRALATAALAQPKVFVHRDFHSRNLMLARDGALSVIDFQDAVRGPLSYDLVSLLRDCYVRWPDARVQAWIDDYRDRLADAGIADLPRERFRRDVDLMGLQRHIKVLGIFCRLWYRDGKAGYLADLPRVWSYVRDVGRRHDETRELVALLERALGERRIDAPREAA